LIEERSAGAVVYHQGEGAQYLLLLYPASHWDFPKGNVEAGEDDVDTVKREVEEETGIRDILLDKGFKSSVEYYYHRAGEGMVHKRVNFYLAHTETREVRLSHEHRDFAWFPLEEALKRLTYDNSRRVLSEAADHLKSTTVTSSLDEYLQQHPPDR